MPPAVHAAPQIRIAAAAVFLRFQPRGPNNSITEKKTSAAQKGALDGGENKTSNPMAFSWNDTHTQTDTARWKEKDGAKKKRDREVNFAVDLETWRNGEQGEGPAADNRRSAEEKTRETRGVRRGACNCITGRIPVAMASRNSVRVSAAHTKGGSGPTCSTIRRASLCLGAAEKSSNSAGKPSPHSSIQHVHSRL